MCEVRFAELVLLKLPKVLQIRALVKTNGPIVVLALNRILQRLPLGVALNTGVVRPNEVELGRVHDVGLHGTSGVFAAWPMTPFTAHVPFSRCLCLYVVIDRMTAVTQRSCRALHV